METADGKELSASLKSLEMKNDEMTPDDYFRYQNRLPTRFGRIFLDGKVVVPSGMQKWNLDIRHFAQPGDKKG